MQKPNKPLLTLHESFCPRAQRRVRGQAWGSILMNVFEVVVGLGLLGVLRPTPAAPELGALGPATSAHHPACRTGNESTVHAIRSHNRLSISNLTD